MAKSKRRNVTSRNQGNVAVSEPSSLTAVSPEYPKKPEKQDSDLKSLVRMLITEYIDKSLKEIQEKMDQKIEILTRETQNHFKKFRRLWVKR